MERDELAIPSSDRALMDELDTVMEAFLQSACALGQVSATLGTINDHQCTSERSIMLARSYEGRVNRCLRLRNVGPKAVARANYEGFPSKVARSSAKTFVPSVSSREQR